MNRVDLDRYYEDTFSLVRTIVIKIEAVALRDNEVLNRAGYPISSDKRTWRYYKNLAGEYHQTDDPMMISTVETGEEVLFSKENLNMYLATKREYSRGDASFNRLMELYPHQSTLIRGIISPIPYEESIAAEDYKILRYNKNLVLWNEDQLIPKLQAFINSDVNDLLHTEYVHTDDLWLPLMVQQLYAHLVQAVHAIRLEDCFTRHTHDFFIWSHIDSFGDFSVYKNSLSREQVMWLFREIAWIKNNPGKQYTMDKLVHNLLTVANIPLAKYDMVETTETQIDDLTPTPLYRKLQLNLQEQYGRAASFITTERLIRKQSLLAKENSIQESYYLEDALNKGKHSLHSELPTKVLESSMQDTTNSHVDTLMTVVFNEWIYLSGKGVYNGRILVVDPKTGKQVRLPVTDAYHVWKYLIEFSKGNNPIDIGPVPYNNVLKLTPPPIPLIFETAGKQYIDGKTTHDIRNLWVPAVNFVSPDYLIQYSTEVYGLIWKHKKLYSQFYDLNKRARIKNATKQMYASGVIRLGNRTNYVDLLQEYEFFFDDYNVEEAKGFAWEIFKQMTGWDVNNQPSSRVKQSDLIEIMMKLSSYTIQVIKEISDGSNSTELINETFIGDPRLVNGGNRSLGDFKNVPINIPTRLDSLRGLEADRIIATTSKPEMIAGIELKIAVPSTTKLKSAKTPSRIGKATITFANNSYIKPIFREGPADPSAVPDTYYGTLQGKGAEWIRLDNRDYGTLQGDDS